MLVLLEYQTPQNWINIGNDLTWQMKIQDQLNTSATSSPTFFSAKVSDGNVADEVQEKKERLLHEPWGVIASLL